ncbi:TetR/AcrR family transcriptional regulator [Trinickia fusca]|uniref:TetR/AcrR family transcriptional regulator n=1 Tax=Trinickia fusca TaxID=2419777 RepID=A0A494XPC9_9BURK|nr:TetR/AcrR family transcriptional regulator [Trinickia fusca]RKP52507.1 TetR/AcrR family transcriptional regulator [Trinickia fusca]
MKQRQRLTREQSKDQTRERLIDAAQKIFMKKGYVAASVEDIAAAAGYTRGAFYSNFRSKPELLMELLQRDHERMDRDLQAIFDEGATREQMQARAIALYSQFFRDEDACFLLWVEAKLLAIRDAKFRTRFSAFTKEKRDYLANYIRLFSERAGTPLQLPAETLALGLMSLCDGVQFFRMTDPQEINEDLIESVLAGFFSRVMFS